MSAKSRAKRPTTQAPPSIQPGRGDVLAAYVHNLDVSHSFMESMMGLMAFDLTHNQRLFTAGGPLKMRCASGKLPEARNEIMRTFLDETEAEWLWMVDTDMGFQPDIVEQLVHAADAQERPVVGGLCFSMREFGPDGYGGFLVRPAPTIFDWGRNPQGQAGFFIRRDYPENALTQVAGTGAACILIHRSAAEKIRAQFGDSWFDLVRFNDRKAETISEDLAFCYRLNSVGLPLFVHTGAKTTHHKSVWLGDDLFAMFESYAETLRQAEAGEPA